MTIEFKPLINDQRPMLCGHTMFKDKDGNYRLVASIESSYISADGGINWTRRPLKNNMSTGNAMGALSLREFIPLNDNSNRYITYQLLTSSLVISDLDTCELISLNDVLGDSGSIDAMFDRNGKIYFITNTADLYEVTGTSVKFVVNIMDSVGIDRTMKRSTLIYSFRNYFVLVNHRGSPDTRFQYSEDAITWHSVAVSDPIWTLLTQRKLMCFHDDASNTTIYVAGSSYTTDITAPDSWQTFCSDAESYLYHANNYLVVDGRKYIVLSNGMIADITGDEVLTYQVTLYSTITTPVFAHDGKIIICSDGIKKFDPVTKTSSTTIVGIVGERLDCIYRDDDTYFIVDRAARMYRTRDFEHFDPVVCATNKQLATCKLFDDKLYFGCEEFYSEFGGLLKDSDNAIGVPLYVGPPNGGNIRADLSARIGDGPDAPMAVVYENPYSATGYVCSIGGGAPFDIECAELKTDLSLSSSIRLNYIEEDRLWIMFDNTYNEFLAAVTSDLENWRKVPLHSELSLRYDEDDEINFWHVLKHNSMYVITSDTGVTITPDLFDLSKYLIGVNSHRMHSMVEFKGKHYCIGRLDSAGDSQRIHSTCDYVVWDETPLDDSVIIFNMHVDDGVLVATGRLPSNMRKVVFYTHDGEVWHRLFSDTLNEVDEYIVDEDNNPFEYDTISTHSNVVHHGGKWFFNIRGEGGGLLIIENGVCKTVCASTDDEFVSMMKYKDQLILITRDEAYAVDLTDNEGFDTI